MRSRLAVSVVIAVGGCLFAPAAAPASAAARCEQVSFRPNTDSLASDITARGIGCRSARALVRRAERDITPFGYRCFTRKVTPQGLEYTRWYCRKGAARVRWKRF